LLDGGAAKGGQFDPQGQQQCSPEESADAAAPTTRSTIAPSIFTWQYAASNQAGVVTCSVWKPAMDREVFGTLHEIAPSR